MRLTSLVHRYFPYQCVRSRITNAGNDRFYCISITGDRHAVRRITACYVRRLAQDNSISPELNPIDTMGPGLVCVAAATPQYIAIRFASFTVMAPAARAPAIPPLEWPTTAAGYMPFVERASTSAIWMAVVSG